MRKIISSLLTLMLIFFMGTVYAADEYIFGLEYIGNVEVSNVENPTPNDTLNNTPNYKPNKIPNGTLDPNTLVNNTITETSKTGWSFGEMLILVISILAIVLVVYLVYNKKLKI